MRLLAERLRVGDRLGTGARRRYNFPVKRDPRLQGPSSDHHRALAEPTRREHREMRADIEAVDAADGAPHPRAERSAAAAGRPAATGGAGLAGIGRPAAPADVVDLLVECHARIRTFLALARRIAEARGVADAEIAGAAARVRRYFAEALPLHARDEEESVLPRLAGHDPALDDALARMRAEHAEHGEPLARLLEACGTLAGEPGALERVRLALLAAAADLAAHFAVHLEAEERIVFPAIRAHLGPEARAQIADELRARRTSPIAGHRVHARDVPG